MGPLKQRNLCRSKIDFQASSLTTAAAGQSFYESWEGRDDVVVAHWLEGRPHHLCC